MFLKLAVEAKLPTVAGVVIALGGDHAVETPFAAIIGDIGVLDAVFLALGPAEARLHIIILGHLALPIQVDVFFDGREVLETLPQVVEADLVVLEHADHLHKEGR
jgi:hypothetical protein